jgi:hypothetical protein
MALFALIKTVAKVIPKVILKEIAERIKVYGLAGKGK